jgi:hypothetical protein
VLGDTVPIRYEIRDGQGIARLELREGQARRLTPADLPRLDRPLHFAVVRGNRPAVEAETIEALEAALQSRAQSERRVRKPPRHRRR